MNLKNVFLLVSFLFLVVSPVWSQGFENRNLPNFNKIKISGNIIANLTKGIKQGVQINAIDLEPNKVNTYVENGELRINIQDGIFRGGHIAIDIEYVELEGIEASSNCEVYMENTIKQPSFDVKVSSAAYLKITVDVNEIDIALHTGGELDISGTARKQKSKVLSGSIMHGFYLTSEEIDIKANTAGQAEVTATNMIKATSATGASIIYKGQPKIENVKGNAGGEVSRF